MALRKSEFDVISDEEGIKKYASGTVSDRKPKRQKTNAESAENRKYLKAYELLPAQLLNAYR